MEKITFIDPETKEETAFFVLEETQINGIRYLFVTEEEEDDCDAYILKETDAQETDIVYEMVEDDEELLAISKVFEQMLDDVDLEM